MGDVLPEKAQTKNFKLEYTKPGFLLHSFCLELEDDKVFYQIIKMLDSVYIWIGKKDKPLLTNMALAMQSKYDSVPITTKLIGDELETSSKNIACRLSRRLNKVVYVSFNVEESRFNVPIIEKRLNEEIKKFPEKF